MDKRVNEFEGNTSKRKYLVIAAGSVAVLFIVLIVLAGVIASPDVDAGKNADVLNLDSPPLGYVNSNSYIYDSQGNIREVNREIQKETVGVRGSSLQTPKSNGYIIQFEDKPILEEKNELDKQAELNKEYIANSAFYNPVRYYKQLFSVMPEDVNKDVEDYSKNLEKGNEKVKQKILEKINANRKSITGNAVLESEEELKIENEFKNTFNGISLNVSDEEAKEIEKISGVKKVYPNLEVQATLMDSVPLINADDVWQLDEDGNNCSVSEKDCLTGKNVTIAIIDTGIDYTHEDLGGCFGNDCKVIGGYDFVNNDEDPMDDLGHGTHCAGIAAGNGVLKGVAPDAKLYAYKVLDLEGSGWEDDIIAAIDRAVDLNGNNISCENNDDYVDVISLSLGGLGNPDDAMSTAIDNAALCTVPVIAAGNSGPYKQSIGSPGTARKAITVGAIYKSEFDKLSYGNCEDENTQIDDIACFSSRGPVFWEDSEGVYTYLMKPDIIAPGVEICSAQWDTAFGIDEYYEDSYRPDVHRCVDGEHMAISGTSMATPIVAGAAALLRQMHSDWTSEEVKYSLMENAVDLEYSQNEQGKGRLNLRYTDKKPNIVRLDELKLRIPFEIKGKIDVENFSNYKIYLKKIWEDDWVEIFSSDILLGADVLGTYDIGILEDEEYQLKLEVRDIFNNVYTDEGEFVLKKFDFIFPRENALLNNKDPYPIIIKNNIPGLVVDDYEIKTAKLEYEGFYVPLENESDLGIILEQEGEKIGEWDTSLYEEGLYGLIVRLNYKGISSSFLNNIFLDKNLRSGWPRPIQDTSGLWGIYDSALGLMNQPTIYDLNNDGIKEIIIAYGEGEGNEKVYAFEPDGSSLEGFPVTLPGEGIQRGPVVIDSDDNGYGEIFVVGEHINESMPFNSWSRAIYRIKHDGSFIFSRNNDVNPIFSDDLNLDGIPEIFGTQYVDADIIYIFKPDLEYFNENWPLDLRDYGVKSRVSLVNGSLEDIPLEFLISIDVDGDGIKEIISQIIHGVRIQEGDWFYFYPLNTSFYAFDLQGNLVSGWPKNFDEVIFCQQKADFDMDDELEFLCMGNKIEGEKQDLTVSILSSSGEVEDRFEYEFEHTNESRFEFFSMNVGDIDGKRSIVITGRKIHKYYWGGGGAIAILIDNDGNKKEININENGFWNSGFYPIGKITLSDNTEFSMGFRQGIIDDSEGTIRWGGSTEYFSDVLGNRYKIYMGEIPLGDGNIISDLDGDGKNEIIAVGWGGDLYVWNTEGQDYEDEWNEIFYDAQHSICYKCPESRLQSKIVNNENFDIKGSLNLKLQKKINESWSTERVVGSEVLSIPATSSVSIAEYWNNKNISVSSEGEYRVYGTFIVDEEIKESSWEFVVSGSGGNESICGNGICEFDETSITCPEDCNFSEIICYSDNDCPDATENYCSGNFSRFSLTTYECVNDGTVNSECIVNGGGSSWTFCSEGCNINTGKCVNASSSFLLDVLRQED